MKSGPKCRVPNRTPIVVSTTLTANSATTQHDGFLDGGAQPLGATANCRSAVIADHARDEAHSAEYLAEVAAELNNRPRKRCDFDSPAQVLNRLLSQPPQVTVASEP